MNKTDAIEIENLLKNAKDMKDMATQANALFKNSTISAYCKSAKEDFNDLKAYILQKIDENLELLLNIKKVHLSDGVYDNGYVAIRDHKPVVIRLNDMFYISFYINPTRLLNLKRGNCGGYEVDLLRDEIELKDVWVHTSDTSRWEYNLVNCYGFWQEGKDLNVPKYLYTAQSGKWWEQAKCLADNTKKYGELLWGQFKKCIIAKTAQYKANADTGNETRKRGSEAAEALVYVAIKKV